MRDNGITANLDFSMLDRYPAYLEGRNDLSMNDTMFASFAHAKGLTMDFVPKLRLLAATEVTNALKVQKTWREKAESLMSDEDKEAKAEVFKGPSYSLEKPEMALYTCLDRNSEPGMSLKFYPF